MRNVRTALTVVALVSALALAGCASDDEPEGDGTSASPSATASASASQTESPTASASPTKKPAEQGVALKVTVAGDEVTPNAKTAEAEVGDKVTLRVSSDRAGELHVHSTPEHTFAFESGSSTFSFTAKQPGSVDIEEHESGVLVYRLLVR